MRRFVFCAAARILLAIAFTFGLMAIPGIAESASAGETMAAGARYQVLAWNDLGMHCYNGSFADMMVLPPYNTLWAQVVRVDDPPSIVTTGVVVSYAFPGNTYSAGKTDFWDYATQLFGLPTPLPANVGLRGKGLTGTLDPVGEHFTAAGIPLTEFSDADTQTRQPYQTAIITVRDAVSGAVLTSATVVAPVSSEMNCVMCHADTGDATTRYPITPTGDFQANILALHDYLSQSKYPAGHKGTLLGRKPVLCAECHADAALGAPGIPGISSLSNAMHRHHNPTNAPDIAPNNDGCYNCHPGMDTQCLRCVMSQRYGIGCVDCHGDIVQVAKNPTPWVSEPKCSNPTCHGAAYATDQPLYRNSKGHGGLYCATCHDSPHAIAVSREASDAIKFIDLQGSAGTLRVCTTCHSTMPTGAFRHAMLVAPVIPVVKSPTRLTIGNLHSSYSRWTTFKVSGIVLPKHTARSSRVVYIELYRRLSGHWVLHKTVAAKLGNNGSYYAASVQLQHRGQWRMRPYTPSDSRHLATYGPSDYIDAR